MMKNEELAMLIEHAKSVPVYPTDKLLVELAEDLLKRRTDSQPEPVEAKEESTFEKDPDKRCRKNHPSGYRFCTRRKGHAGDHHEHSLMDGSFLASWPDESPAPPKRDYGRERAEKINIDVDNPVRSTAVWVAALRDDIAAALNSARADGIEEVARVLDARAYSTLSDAVRGLK